MTEQTTPTNPTTVVVGAPAPATTPAVVLTTPTPPQQIVTMPKSTFDSADRRKDYALWIITGGGMAMTAYAVAVLYLIQHNEKYVYYLGLASMLNIFVLFGAIAGLLVKRTMNITKSGIQIEDHDSQDKQS